LIAVCLNYISIKFSSHETYVPPSFPAAPGEGGHRL
jgi:hypothetical protein